MNEEFITWDGKPMDAHELRNMYADAMIGDALPEYIAVDLPNVGFVEVTKKALKVNGEDANPEQRTEILRWLHN